MSLKTHRNRRRGSTVLALAAAVLAWRVGAVRADVSWTAGTGNWSTAGDWNLNRIPASSDNVSIIDADSTNRTVTLDVSSSILALQVGNTGGGTNTLSETAAVTLTAGGNLTLGPSAASKGTFTLNGASSIFADNANVYVGGSSTAAGGKGILNIKNGTATIAGSLNIWNTSGTAVNLSGGSLTAASINVNGNPADFNWTGGTFTLTGSTGFPFSQVASGTYLQLSPGVADSTVTGPAGGLTNNGTIAFDSPGGAYNVTYTGNLTNKATIRYRGGGGGTRNIAGTLDNFGTIAANSTDDTILSASSIKLETGSQFFTQIGPPGFSSYLNATNANGLNIAGSTTINLASTRALSSDGYSVGTYVLMHYNGALAGSLSNLAIGTSSSSYAYQFINDAANGNVDLDIVPASQQTWSGATDATWNGANWNAAAPDASHLAVFPSPVAAGRPTITLGSGENANGLSVNDNYTFSGGSLALNNGLVDVASGKTAIIASNLNGAWGLQKSGLGTLKLTGANTYAGPTVANYGTLVAGTANTFPSGATLHASGGTIDTGGLNQSVATVILSSGNINVHGGTLSVSNGVEVNASAGAGAINLSSGTLSTPSYQTNANKTSLNWTGGTLKLTGTGAVPVTAVPAGATLSLNPTASNVIITGQALAGSGPAKPAVLSIPSPNYYNNRSGQPIDAIVIHTTEESYAATVSQFQTPGQDSANYVNNTDGTITEMVDPATGHAAWHATYYNDRAIGIENVGYSNQSNTWNPNNIASLEKLVAYLAYTYNVPVLRPTDNDQYNIPITTTWTTNPTFDEPGIVAHAQVQPWDRYDPGQYFPWSSFITDVQNLIANSINPSSLTNNGTINVANTGGYGITYRGDINNLGAMNVTNTNFAINGNLATSGAVTLNGGTLNVTGTNVNSAGSVNVHSGNASFGNLTVNNGGSVIASHGAGAILRTQQLTMAGSGKIDLADNKLIISGSPVGSWNGNSYSGVTALIASGRNGGAWNGGGIVTSMSAAQGSASLTTLAVATAASVNKTTFGGQSVSPSDVLVMYTYAGDANLDGKIDGDDYFQIDSHVNQGGNSAVSYADGDFNYDGKINGDDYFIIDSNINQQGAAFSSAAPVDALGSVAPVPEPLGLIPLLSTALFLRRRRKNLSRT